MKELFSFKGRAKRSEYWLIHISSLVVIILILFLADYIYPGSSPEDLSDSATITFRVFSIPFIWLNLATHARRWHDRNKSGFWILKFL